MQENVQQQGWRTYLYDAEQPYTPVASVTGKGESRQVWYYHTDVTGTPQEVTAADGTLVWAGYIRGLEKMRRTSATAGRTFTSRCGCRGSILTTRQGCITICSDIMHRSVDGSSVRIRLGWRGLNLYQYAPNPIRWIDPLGLAIWSINLILMRQGEPDLKMRV